MSGPDVQRATAAAEAIEAAGTPTDAVMATQIATPSSATRQALNDTFGSLPFNLGIAQLDRQGEAILASTRARVRLGFETATEVLEPWNDLTGVNAIAVQVSDNRLTDGAGTAPKAAKKAFDLAGTVGRASCVIDYQGTGTIMFGVSGGAAGGAPVTGSTDSFLIGFRGSGVIGYLRGSGIGGTGQADLGTGAAPFDRYLATVLVDENTVSLTLRSLSTGDEWRRSVPRSAFDSLGGVTNIALYNSRSSSSVPYTYHEPISAVKGSYTLKTKTIAGRVVQGTEPTAAYLAKTGDNYRLQLPAGYDPRVPRPLVLWCHNAGGTASGLQDDARMKILMTALDAAGYPVLSADAGGQAWGNDTQTALYQTAYEYARSRIAVSGVVLVGNSMGQQSALQLLKRRTIPNVLAFLGIAGVASLGDLYKNGYSGPINTAFGVTSIDQVPDEFKPERAAGWEFRGVPMMMVNSPTDAACTFAETEALVAKIAPYAEITLITSTGAHMAAQQFTDAVTHGIPFLARYAPV